MSNSANITAQKDCPYAADSVDVATSATPEFEGDATFAQAFGAGPIDVYWALQDDSTPPKFMAGIGSLNAGAIDVSTPSATFDGTTYDNAPSGTIALTTPVTIRCTVNASVFDSKLSALEEDTAPRLGGHLGTKDHGIWLSDGADAVTGVLVKTASGAALAHSIDGTYDPADGAILVGAGKVTFGGSVANFVALEGADTRDVRVAADGTLYAATLPAAGWLVTDTDNGDYSLDTLGVWVNITGLVNLCVEAVADGDQLNLMLNLSIVNNDATREGTIDIGFGLGVSVEPLSPAQNIPIRGGFDSNVAVNIATTTHGGLAQDDAISVWARRATQTHNNFAPELEGSIGRIHEFILSIPGDSGSSGLPTDLDNTPGTSSVTVTSSTGTDTVLVGAVSGAAGVMTGAQVDLLGSALQSETDPVFGASAAGGIVTQDVTNWDIAFGWGDHGVAGYTVGPASSIDGQIAVFDGDTGKILRDSGNVPTDFEAWLDNPATDDWVLSSKVDGTRSWVASGGSNPDAMLKADYDFNLNGISDLSEGIGGYAKNSTGGTIAAGTPVYIVSYDEGSGIAQVSTADANDPSKMPAVGITDVEITNNSEGLIITAGMQWGLDTSAFATDDSIYVSTSGTLTNVRPTGAAELVQKLGQVVRSHGTLGSINLTGAGRANDIPNALTVNNTVTFDTVGSTAGVEGGVTYVDFTDGNKQEITGTVTTTIGDWTFPGVGSYTLSILSSVTVSALTAADSAEFGATAYGFPPGKAHEIGILWDGVTAKWMATESVA